MCDLAEVHCHDVEQLVVEVDSFRVLGYEDFLPWDKGARGYGASEVVYTLVACEDVHSKGTEGNDDVGGSGYDFLTKTFDLLREFGGGDKAFLICVEGTHTAVTTVGYNAVSVEDPGLGEDLFKGSSVGADEWSAVCFFDLAWGFANEHDFRGARRDYCFYWHVILPL